MTPTTTTRRSKLNYRHKGTNLFPPASRVPFDSQNCLLKLVSCPYSGVWHIPCCHVRIMEITKPHVLVVDDEMGPRESLKMILNPYYTVHTAERGGQAVEMLGKFPVDLVTLDLKMPGLSGIHVLEKLKEYDPDIEAIIITGYGSLDTAIEGLRLGAFDYISKPFDVNHILSLVRRGLERRNAKSKLRQVKSDFLSNVSHELRTPLSVVVGFVYLLLNQVIGKLSEE